MKPLCYYGDPVLRKKCKEVEEITPFVRKVISEMIASVKVYNGAGIAAPQIGYDLRIFINVFSEETDEDGFPLALEHPEVYINPKIINSSKKQFVNREGCLSIPGISLDVGRSNEIDIEYTDMDGKKIVKKNQKGWRAKCLQHEMDHLNGILFIDHISKEERAEVTPILIALEKKTKEKSVMPKDFL